MSRKPKHPQPRLGLKLFIAELREGGWITSDGEDRCHTCHDEYLDLFPDDREVVAADCKPTHTFACTRRAAEGWFTECEGCHVGVFVPYTEGERRGLVPELCEAEHRMRS